MSAKDYEICPALFNAYIAKKSKRNPNMMTNDRRVITDGEILFLIDWYIDNKVEEQTGSITFDSIIRKGKQVQIKIVDK